MFEEKIIIQFNPESAEEILSRPAEPTTWLWENYIAAGDFFVFAAYMKVGKSTFFYPLTLAIARGTDFLGYPTNKTPTLILALEEHSRDVAQRLRKLGMQPDDEIYVHNGPLPNTPWELAELQKFIEEQEIGLVFLDSLPYWWDVRDENNNAEIMRKLTPLHQLCRATNCAIGLVHHESKYGGRNGTTGESHGDGKSIRGGGATFGLIDQALMLDRRHGGPSNRRVLRTIGRHSESPRELFLELRGNPSLSEPQPYEFVSLGTSDKVNEATVKEKLLAVLTTDYKEISEIARLSGVSPKLSRAGLEVLRAENNAERCGRGVRGDPYKYKLLGQTVRAEGNPVQEQGE